MFFLGSHCVTHQLPWLWSVTAATVPLSTKRTANHQTSLGSHLVSSLLPQAPPSPPGISAALKPLPREKPWEGALLRRTSLTQNQMQTRRLLFKTEHNTHTPHLLSSEDQELQLQRPPDHSASTMATSRLNPRACPGCHRTLESPIQP